MTPAGDPPPSPFPAPAAPPWTTAVLVCQKCFARPDGPAGGGDGHAVKARLKQALRDLKPAVRTLEVSCLDCCPPGAFAIAITSPSAAPQAFALTSIEQTDAIVELVRSRHKPAAC